MKIKGRLKKIKKNGLKGKKMNLILGLTLLFSPITPLLAKEKQTKTQEQKQTVDYLLSKACKNIFSKKINKFIDYGTMSHNFFLLTNYFIKEKKYLEAGIVTRLNSILLMDLHLILGVRQSQEDKSLKKIFDKARETYLQSITLLQQTYCDREDPSYEHEFSIIEQGVPQVFINLINTGANLDYFSEEYEYIKEIVEKRNIKFGENSLENTLIVSRALFTETKDLLEKIKNEKNHRKKIMMYEKVLDLYTHGFLLYILASNSSEFSGKSFSELGLGIGTENNEKLLTSFISNLSNFSFKLNEEAQASYEKEEGLNINTMGKINNMRKAMLDRTGFIFSYFYLKESNLKKD